MANSGKSKPSQLSIPQIADIHLNHPPTGKALDTIIEYINKNLPPVQGNKVAPSPKNPGGNP